jgi:FG-GAP-like repeat
MQSIDSSRPTRHRAWRRLAFVLVGLPVAGLFGGAITATAQAVPASAFSFGNSPADAVITAAGRHLCGNLTAASLAAMAISVTFNETGAGANQTPSPMTLSRSDNQAGLHAFKTTGTSEDRAFWHPGVGAFQLDSAGLGSNTDAAGAINVATAADITTASMASAYCRTSGSDATKRSAAWQPWVACHSGGCEPIFGSIFQGGKLSVTRDSAVANFGGMQQRTCSRGGTTFPCFFVDPNKAQGHTAWRSPGFGPSPITLPFYVFTSTNSSGNKVEERHWLMADTGFSENVSATRAYGTNARSGLFWAHSSDIKVVSTTPTPPPALPPIPNAARKAGGRDFTADGKSDIYWYGWGDIHETMWTGTSTVGKFAEIGAEQVTGGYVPLGGDFNGDGHDDVFWYGVGTAPDKFWLGDGTTFANTSILDSTGAAMAVNGYYSPIVGDFDGDGRDDIFWYARTDSQDTVWYGTANGRFAPKQPTNVSFTGYTPVSGDFDGDGKTDIFWYAPGDGNDSIWQGSSSRTFVTKAVKQVSGTYSPVAGDFNGDGKDDIFWYSGGSTGDTLWLSTGGFTFQGVAETVNGLYVPIAGDYNGDGKDDIFWYGPGSEADSVWTSTGTSGAFTKNAETVNGADYRPV